MGILVFLLVLTVVIAIHEYGHYLACRLCGIPVKQFAIGIGKPLLKHTDARGTEWSLRPIPLGGYIKPDEIPMTYAKPWKKAFVAVAGPLANLISVAVIALLIGKFGLLLDILPTAYFETGKALFSLLTFGVFEAPAVVAASAPSGMSGPIGIATLTVGLTNQLGGFFTFALLFGAVSIGIAMVNLLPVPLLDGGRIVLAGVEAGIGRKKTERVERYTNVIGAIIILALFVLTTVGDIGNLF